MLRVSTMGRRSSSMNEPECEVLAYKLNISEHPNADKLEMAKCEGFRCVVGKGQFQTGDLALYIPNQTMVSEAILRELNLWDDEKQRGLLSRTNGQVTKVITLRGEVSEGLIYKPDIELIEGENYADQFGLTKWTPTIPTHMSGQVEGNSNLIPWISIPRFEKLDPEMWSKFNVSATAKIHGSAFTATRTAEGEHLISSKGQGRKGLVIKESESNVYWRAYHQYGLAEVMETLAAAYFVRDADSFFLGGEVYGTSINGFSYGLKPGELGFKIFDAGAKYDNELKWLDYQQLRSLFPSDLLVPELYSGKFDHDKIWQIACSDTPVYPGQDHVNEGVVVRSTGYPHMIPVFDDYGNRYEKRYDRQVAKMINPAYLLRKGNDTEYE